MAGLTDHYNLSTMSFGDKFSDNGYKFTSADRRLIDSLLHLGATGHRHTGDAGAIVEPTLPPAVSLSTTGGTIPSGTRVYYRYTYVNERGEESKRSPEAFVDTPVAVTEPGGPSLSRASTGGSLGGGNYYYVLSAYVGSSIAETRAVNSVYISVPVGTQTNTITLGLPTLPAGATGFNIYRREPGQTKLFFLTSVNMGGATPPSTYIDTGALQEDCDRTLPVRNTTNSTNSITVTQPGATPAVPVGYTWKLYRTYANGNYTGSLLDWIVEYVSELSTVVTPTYLDVGVSTSDGEPPQNSQLIDSPSRVMLTDMAEVQGILPMGAVVYPFVVTFEHPGSLAAGDGERMWMCEFPYAEIVGVRAHLGFDSEPVAQDVIVNVNAIYSVFGSLIKSSVFTDPGDRPTVPVGQTIGQRVPATAVPILGEGQLLSVDIDQAGGGATPTDRDLTVTIYMYVAGFSDVSFIPDL